MASEKHITLKLYVDRSTDRVVFAEAGDDFIDILLSFLTLPLATIIRLGEDQSPMHCMNRLYESVKSLDEDYLNTKNCRSMLLNPINSAAEHLQRLKINIDHTGAPRYFICERSCDCGQLSLFPGIRCRFDRPMTKEVYLLCRSFEPLDEGEFVQGEARYTISDDLVISPSSTEDILTLLFERIGVEDRSNLAEKEVKISSSDVLRLLNRCLVSRTVLTDAFLVEQKNDDISFQPRISRAQIPNTLAESTPSPKIRVKLVLKKFNKTLLFAVANQDFVDLLFSFLTYPIGSVVKHLDGECHMACIDNLYKSTVCLSSAGYLKEVECRDILLSPKLPPHYGLMSKLVKTDEAAPEKYYMCQKSYCYNSDLSSIPNGLCGCKTDTNKPLTLEDPKNPNIPNNQPIGGFLRSASYVVTDDLVATPLSSDSEASNHLEDVQEGVDIMTVEIGEEEALELLKASLSSKTALTDALLRKKDSEAAFVLVDSTGLEQELVLFSDY